MKAIFITTTLLIFAAITLSPSTANANQQACYSKGKYVHCALPNADRRNVGLAEEYSNNKCEKGYSWGTDSKGIWVDRKCKGMFYSSSEDGSHNDYEESYSRHDRRSGSCPSEIRGNECAYYEDGYNAGKSDGEASMSRMYDRYSDDYDSRFEKYFASGYQDGWNDYR